MAFLGGLGVSLGGLGWSSPPLERILGRLGRLQGRLGPSWAPLSPLLARLGRVLGGAWAALVAKGGEGGRGLRVFDNFWYPF